jgi:GntR family transcriptional regulator
VTATLAREPAEPRKRSAPSIYVRIANELRDLILENNLAPNTLLPSERELGEQHGVSRMTARHALSLLENEGYIYRRPPRGTFVAEPRVSFRIGSFTTEIERLGRQPGADVVWAELVDPPSAAREAFELPEGDQVVGLQRVRRADLEPIAIETTYLKPGLVPGFLEHDLHGSLWTVLSEHYDIVPENAHASIESIVLDDASCARLRVRSASPGILLTRVTKDSSGQCFEYARDIYRADRAKFEIDANLR